VVLFYAKLQLPSRLGIVSARQRAPTPPSGAIPLTAIAAYVVGTPQVSYQQWRSQKNCRAWKRTRFPPAMGTITKP